MKSTNKMKERKLNKSNENVEVASTNNSMVKFKINTNSFFLLQLLLSLFITV